MPLLPQSLAALARLLSTSRLSKPERLPLPQPCQLAAVWACYRCVLIIKKPSGCRASMSTFITLSWGLSQQRIPWRRRIAKNSGSSIRSYLCLVPVSYLRLVGFRVTSDLVDTALDTYKWILANWCKPAWKLEYGNDEKRCSESPGKRHANLRFSEVCYVP